MSLFNWLFGDEEIDRKVSEGFQERADAEFATIKGLPERVHVVLFSADGLFVPITHRVGATTVLDGDVYKIFYVEQMGGKILAAAYNVNVKQNDCEDSTRKDFLNRLGNKDSVLNDFDKNLVLENSGVLKVECIRWGEPHEVSICIPSDISEENKIKIKEKAKETLRHRWCDFFAYESKEEHDKHLNGEMDFSTEEGRNWVHSFSERRNSNLESLR